MRLVTTVSRTQSPTSTTTLHRSSWSISELRRRSIRSDQKAPISAARSCPEFGYLAKHCLNEPQSCLKSNLRLPRPRWVRTPCTPCRLASCWAMRGLWMLSRFGSTRRWAATRRSFPPAASATYSPASASRSRSTSRRSPSTDYVSSALRFNGRESMLQRLRHAHLACAEEVRSHIEPNAAHARLARLLGQLSCEYPVGRAEVFKIGHDKRSDRALPLVDRMNVEPVGIVEAVFKVM